MIGKTKNLTPISFSIHIDPDTDTHTELQVILDIKPDMEGNMIGVHSSK